MDKLLGENEYLKGMLIKIEVELKSEMDRRLKQDFEQKAHFD